MIAASPKTIPAGQLGPSWSRTSSATKTGIAAKRAIVSALGICRSGCGDRRGTQCSSVRRLVSSPVPRTAALSRLRQRPQPRVPARPSRTRRRRRLLGLARRHARGGRPPHARDGARALRPHVPRDAAPRLHRRRRVPLPRARRRPSRLRRPPTEAGIGFTCLHVAYARGGLERMRQASVAAYLAEVEALRARGIDVGVAPHSVRACPRDWLEEIGALRSRRGARPARPRRRAAARDRGVPRRARHAPDRAARRARGASASGRPSSTRRTRTAPSSTSSATAALADLRVPDDRGRPGRRVPSRRPRPAPRDPALHRLRLERPDRPVRGAPRARGDRAAAGGPPRRALDRRAVGRSAARAARPRSGSTRGPAIEVDLDHRSLDGVADGASPRGARRRLRRRRRVAPGEGVPGT